MKIGLEVEWKLASRYNIHKRLPGGELIVWCGSWLLDMALVKGFLMEDWISNAWRLD
jgi:hypothetical protein